MDMVDALTPDAPRSPTRPTSIAVTGKRSFTVLVTVEVNHKPSGVASPSSRWNTQRRRARIQWVVASRPGNPRLLLAPIWFHGMTLGVLVPAAAPVRHLLTNRGIRMKSRRRTAR